VTLVLFLCLNVRAILRLLDTTSTAVAGIICERLTGPIHRYLTSCGKIEASDCLTACPGHHHQTNRLYLP
jgi:hypothetical protein